MLNPPAPKGFICEEELPEGEPDEELPPGAGMGSDWARRAGGKIIVPHRVQASTRVASEADIVLHLKLEFPRLAGSQ